MSQSRTWAASHSAAVNFTKLTGCGGSIRLYAGNAGASEMRSFISFTVDWTGVGKIVSAVLQVYTDDQNGLIPPPGTNTPQAVVRRLTGTFVQGNNADGVFDASDYTAPTATASNQAISNMAKAPNGVTSIDITAIVEDAAPGTVQKRNGTPGGGLPWHGLGMQRDGASKTNGWSGWSHMYTTDATKQPVIVLTYDLAPTAPAAPSSLTPTGSTTQGTFEGDFTSTDSSDTLNAAEVEVYPDSATNSGQTVTGTVIWSQKSPASAAQSLAAHFILSPDNLPTVTGTPYKWRARVYATKGGVGPWTNLVEYTETNSPPNAPTLSPVSGTTVATMNAIQFTGGTFSDPDAGDVLAGYQIEMSAYPSGDAHWTDDAFLLWNTGKVLTPAGATSWQRAYGGNALTAGTYYWRARVWDQREGISSWTYASIILTTDFNPVPGSQDTPQINPHAPWRIVLRTLKAAATVGGGTLTGAHSTSLLTTGSAHGLAAGATIKFATLAGGTGLTTTAYYYVLAAGLTTTAFKVSLIPGTTGAVATFSSDVTSGSVVQYTRGPGNIVGILENAKSVGASIVYNSPGQLHFTLDIDHEQISVCLPRLTHYALEFYGGDGWREVFAGLLTDFDATETSVIFQGVDYLGLFASNYDERYDPSNAELPVPTGSKYVNKTIGYVIKDQLATAIARSNSIVGFISVGDIAGYASEVSPGALSEKVTIYSTFQATLPFVASLIESHKQGTGKNTQVSVVKNTDGSYSVQVVDDPGITRSNLTLRYGELLQGYRVIPFGPNWASTQHLIGRTREGLRVFYETKSAPNIDPGTWGYWAQAQVVEDLADENDAIRRALQQAIVAGKLGKQLGFGIRSGFLQPRDGYDLCDVLPVEIIHGAVDTTRFGDGLWVCFAIAWEAGDDGSQNVILTVLPKDDASSPDPDLIPSVVLSPQAEWQIGWAPPDPLVVAAKFFLNQTTGIGYQRNDDGTYSTIDSSGGLTYPSAPSKPTVSSVTSSVVVADDGTIHGTAVVTVAAPSTSALQQVVFVTPDSGTPVHLVVPLGATTVSLPVKPASVLSVTAYATDTYGNVSIAADAVAHTVAVDSTAPAVPTGSAATGAILGAIITWTKNTEADFDHYDLAISSDGGSTYPVAYATKSNAITLVQLTAGTLYTFKVRAVDTTGNASAYSSTVTATPRTIVTADITALNITTALLAALAVTSAKVAANAIDITKLATGLLPVQVVSSLPTLPNSSQYPIGATIFNTGDSHLYKTTDGNNWIKLVDAGDIVANSITAGQILAGTITTTEIAAGTILALNIAAGTITTSQIAAGTILAANIAAGTITGSLIAGGTITGNLIQAGAITADLLAANIVLASTITAGTAGGASVVLSSAGLQAYNAAGALVVNIPVDGSNVVVNAEIDALRLDVTGTSEFDGAMTFQKGMTATLISSIGAPTTAPGLSQSLDQTVSMPSASNDIGGLDYDAAGGAGGATKVFYTVAKPGITTLELDERLASDLSINRSLTLNVPGGGVWPYFDNYVSVTRLGTYIYVAVMMKPSTVNGQLYVFRITQSTMALHDTYGPIIGSEAAVQTITLVGTPATFKLNYVSPAGLTTLGTTTFTHGVNLTAAAIQTSLRTQTGNASLTVTGTTDTGPFLVTFVGSGVYENVLIPVVTLGTVVAGYDQTNDVEGGFGTSGGALTSDGTNVYLVNRTFRNSATNTIYITKYDATMVRVSSVDTTTDPGTGRPIDAAEGSFDLGAARFAVLFNGGTYGGTVQTFTTAGAIQVNEPWPTLSSPIWFGGVTYGDAKGDGARFWTYSDRDISGSTLILTKHSTWTWTTASALYWVCYAWYDSVGTVHESVVGPRTSITMSRRHQLTVTLPALPGTGGADDPNSWRVYMKPNATDPGAGNFKLQATPTSSPSLLTTYNSAGAADGAGTAFPAGAPAAIASQTAGWSLKGDGSAAITTITGPTTITGKVTAAGLLTLGGSSFPASPASGDIFYRTDLHMEFYYDGTRWLSTQIFVWDMTPPFDQLQVSISASTVEQRVGTTPPLLGGSDIWLLNHISLIWVVTGGTALGASHNWVGTFHKAPDLTTFTTISTVTINSGASAVYRQTINAINALMNNGTTMLQFSRVWVKTGTPGNLLTGDQITYRIVAT